MEIQIFHHAKIIYLIFKNAYPPNFENSETPKLPLGYV
jgi:hypothetical protein